MAKNLKNLRESIDNINEEILALINKRTDLLQQIRQLKDESDTEYFDAEREAQMMEKVLKKNQGPLYNELVQDIFKTIFKTSLNFMGISREKKFLVNANSDHHFPTVQEMFNLENDNPIIIAGPCAVEKLDYLDTIAKFMKSNGLKFLRGGAFKPRTSPYEFQGLGIEGLKLLKEVAKRYNLLTITEVVDTRDVEPIAEYIDVFQIGARNMHNFELLKEVGQGNIPVLLKRGISATLHEFIMAAEYIVLRGNNKVMMCERGIRTYETKTRNTLDISAIPIIKQETKLPIIVDVSHSLGRKDIVNSISKSVIAAGADGIMVEVHPIPELALSDSKQQLNLDEFAGLIQSIRK